MNNLIKIIIFVSVFLVILILPLVLTTKTSKSAFLTDLEYEQRMKQICDHGRQLGATNQECESNFTKHYYRFLEGDSFDPYLYNESLDAQSAQEWNNILQRNYPPYSWDSYK